MKKWLKSSALVLASVGAINWGLSALFELNLVSLLAGTGTIAQVIYALIGVAGVITLIGMFK